MKTTDCVPQKISKFMLASLLGMAALGLIVIGVTLLPILGIIMALPVIALAIYIFQTKLNDQCEIDFNAN
jgi:hypothetical protein